MVAALAILAMSSPRASLAAADCADPPESLSRFAPAAAATSTPNEPWVDGEDRERTLAELRGKAVVVNFWATWCAPCVKEMPAFNRLAAEGEAAGIAVLPLSADREGAPLVRKFYEKNGIARLPVAVDRMSRLARALGVQGLPTTVLFTADGLEAGRVVGAAEWDRPETLAFLKRCLAARG